MSDVGEWLREAKEDEAARKAKESEAVRLKTIPQIGPAVVKGKAKPPPFEFVCVSDLVIKEPDYLVDELLETDALGSIFGEPGAKKSFIAQDLSGCIASGRAYHGRAVQQGAAFYIAGEGHNGLARRFGAWAKHHGTTLKGLPLFTSKCAANFLDAAHTAEVADSIAALAALHGVPRLIVIDTLARNFGDGDENQTKDMNAFVNAVANLKSLYPSCTILIVHHSGLEAKARGRGNSALRGSLDTEFRVETLECGKTKLINTKMKEAPLADALFFETKDIPLGLDSKGREFGSAVLIETEGEDDRIKLTRARQLALSTFREAATKHGALQDDGGRGLHLNHWREVFYLKHTGATTDAKRKAFDRARMDSFLFTAHDDFYMLTGRA